METNSRKRAEGKLREADLWKESLRKEARTYCLAWLLESLTGRIMGLNPRRGDPRRLVLLARIQEDAHDARLHAEENMEVSKKLISSLELAASVYFGDDERGVNIDVQKNRD